MFPFPTTEVVVATYKKPERLRLVLEGFARQHGAVFSVVVADDGSGPEIAEVIAEFSTLSFPIRRVWHEDIGFRKTRILNEAVRTSRAEYLIFVDGDCIPEPHFVRDHLTFARPGRFVAGRRVFLGSALTDHLIRREIALDELFDRRRLILWELTGELRRSRYAMRLPWAWVHLRRRTSRMLKGNNMGIWREDLVRINGFDSSMTGPGGAEDDDIDWRLLAAGCERVWMSGRGCVFHLHHPKTIMDPVNAQRIAEKRAAGEVVCKEGLTESVGELRSGPARM